MAKKKKKPSRDYLETISKITTTIASLVNIYMMIKEILKG